MRFVSALCLAALVAGGLIQPVHATTLTLSGAASQAPITRSTVQSFDGTALDRSFRYDNLTGGTSGPCDPAPAATYAACATGTASVGRVGATAEVLGKDGATGPGGAMSSSRPRCPPNGKIR